jgi:DNA (cytosine-5)-methyltransferase 1
MVTVTGANRGELAVAMPYFARTAHGDVDKSGKRRGQPCHGPLEPFPTVTQSQDSALAVPFLSPVKSWGGGGNEARDIQEPMRTTTTSKGGEHAVIVPHITKFRTNSIGSGADEPVPTVTANSFIKRPGGAAPLGRVDAVLAPFNSYAQQGGNNRSPELPLHTVTASDGDHNTVVGAHLIRCGNGERQGQDPRAVDVEAPLHTVVAQRNNHGAVQAFMQRVAHLAQFNTNPGDRVNPGHAVEEPVSTVATKGPHQAVCTSHLMKMRGTCQHGATVEEPMPTVTSGGNHIAEVRAFLIKYFGTDQDPQLGDPLHTVTSKDRFGLVTVTIDGEEYVIVDIGMRMLTPRELFNAQGFPADYIIDRDAEGRPMTKTAQVAKCGNSVCPPIASALVEANAPSLSGQMELPAVQAA